MKAEFPTLCHVENAGAMILHAIFADGSRLTVDLSAKLERVASADEVAAIRIDEHGHLARLPNGIDLGADNLYAWGIEQRGEASHAMLWEWLHRNDLTQERAAEAIGISRRMLNYYLAAARPIPKTVWLACLGWESQRIKPLRHAEKRPPVAAGIAICPA